MDKGHRKVWARLRAKGIRAGKPRIFVARVKVIIERFPSYGYRRLAAVLGENRKSIQRIRYYNTERPRQALGSRVLAEARQLVHSPDYGFVRIEGRIFSPKKRHLKWFGHRGDVK